MHKSPPPNKTYWPGPESHEPYVDKNKLPKMITKPTLENTKNKSKPDRIIKTFQ